jgi:hypothetical protein
MRDLHFDGNFMRDFAAASRSWSWATWHQTAREREATAQRLLQQVFGAASEEVAASEDEGQPAAE